MRHDEGFGLRNIADNLLSIGDPMSAIQSYLEMHKGPRAILLCLCFGIASVAFFMGAAYNFVVPGGRPSDRWDVLLPSSFLLIAVLLSFAATWMLKRPPRRSFWVTFAFVAAGIVVGAVLVSVAIWRGNWLELIKEIIGSIGTTR